MVPCGMTRSPPGNRQKGRHSWSREGLEQRAGDLTTHPRCRHWLLYKTHPSRELQARVSEEQLTGDSSFQPLSFTTALPPQALRGKGLWEARTRMWCQACGSCLPLGYPWVHWCPWMHWMTWRKIAWLIPEIMSSLRKFTISHSLQHRA